MTAADVLRKAKGFIETRGWGQNRDVGWTEGKRCCAGIAFQLAGTALGTTWDPAFDKACDVFNGVIGTISVPNWNDRPERTVEEVYAAFDKAIEIAEGQS